MTTIDERGRLADRSPLRVLGWLPESPVAIRAVQGVLVVVTPGGPHAITRQGHLRLPASVRHISGLEAGARLLVVAQRDNDRLAVYTASAVESMLRAHSESLPELM